MPLNRDDVKGGMKRGRKPQPLPRADAKAHVAAYRATGHLPSAPQEPQLRPVTANTEKPIRRHGPAYQGEKPAGYEPVGTPLATRGPQRRKQRPYYEVTPDTRTNLERAVDQDVTPILASGQKFASPALTVPAAAAGNVLAQLGGGPAAVSAAEHLRHGQLLPAAVSSAGLLPFGKFGRLAKAAKEATAAEGAAKLFPAGAKRVEPYVNQHLADTGVGSVPDRADAPGFLYHRTDASRFEQIRKEGLKAAQPQGDKPSGVYFARHPLEARGLSWKSHKGSVYLRVKQDAVHAVDFQGDARLSGLEHVSPSSIPPQSLEYLGKDGGWHPLAPSGLPAGAKDVADRLGGAAKLRAAQEKGYSVERAKRIARAEQIMNEVGGEEGHRLALKELAGDLPKLEFTAGKELNRDTLPDLFKHIQEHPELRPYERVRTRSALLRILDGKVPTKSEIRLLGTAFGEADAQKLAGSVGLWKKLGNTGLQLLNVPRALKSSYDLSAPFRQGLVLGARHPRMFASEFKPMLKSFKSENAYNDVMDEIASRPTFKTMQDSKLALTDLENITNREEAFASNLAEVVPGVRSSGRAYVAFLNKFRADAFDNYLKLAESQGLDTTDEKLLASISRWVNYATGRGGQSKFVASHAVGMNAMFFSPRLIASRVNLLFNPVYYAQLDPFARKQALQGMAQLLGGVSLTLYMAKLAGAQVGLDPRSADFGKIKSGNTRVDVMGGFQQYFVFAARMIRGETVSSTSGQVEHLTGGFGKSSRGTLTSRLAQQKLAPVPGFAAGWLNNENFAGQPFHPLPEAGQLLLPLGPENAVQTYRKNGPGPAAVGAVLGSIGFGVNTYGPKADDDFKNQMKTIDKAVNAGQLSPERAAEAKKDLERVHYVQTHDSKANRRQFLIDTMRDQGYAKDEINAALHQLGYEPAG